ncbi:RNA polymerase II-associated protein 3 [Cynoglossus semilaevis]|uniref:RNA polymerase II-associated protein 3 n=1 Tax=Cynoglossus semilaevis TaxID=244447 RepID=A0A3P8WIE9_CYNSE|nr:RNA polymerase II-associated protein 3 [Cynoglossus semilaevis]XP_008314171.1 RNA polymerase II-associated protein 3 [Cynoglossus semilaevis]XP_008314172.1 RNA polymerase II-associated protein 3 [Cynoglossus semilaevis]XP_008314173.1 RNA polymerase II-associated protein 3 [Cynoglossus semilaevis]XP_008314175.1 RNA polymerase II-associated protein 3 [Cynoglossus semilaevis]XP_024913129.1 RNA polymerase II-associated protein 3 [Cynoglossus semilaevis]XP_024913130.1 RNA polymerase II-associat
MMSGNKVVELQVEMRQNAEDMQSYLKELESWETDIKRKDEELRTGGRKPDQKTLPPVRNKDYKNKMRQKRKKTAIVSDGDGDTKAEEEQKKDLRIKGYDYRSWDKFDVDKALAEMDKEESPAESNESDSEDASVDTEKALTEKEKGNTFFKDGKYDDAIESYTRGMSVDPYNPVLPTNRATAFFRLKKYAVAESDCNLAIALDGNYFKAYARRGAARLALKKLESALEDYEMVLKLDPGNTEAQNEVVKIKEALGHQTVQNEAPQPKQEAVPADTEQQRLMEEQRRRQEAVLQKDRGNAYFKEGKYEAAVQCYSQGMEADGLNVLLPANRAMAFLKLEKYKEAEEDCTKAIHLDSTYSKAFARRGTARVALGKVEEAREDFQELLKLEPGNKQALNELQKLDMRLSGLLDTEVGCQRRTVQPIDKPTHLRSTKPLRRIDIEEVSGKVTLLEGESAASNAFVRELGPDPDADSSPLSTSPSAKMIKIEEIEATPTVTANQPVQRMQEETAAPSETTPTAAPPSTVTDLPPPPTSSFQLEATLRKIGKQPEVIYRYLRQINPKCFGKIFQNSLEPDIFNQILKTLKEFYILNEPPSVVLEILSGLASVSRFDMAIMFMSSAEKKMLTDLFDFLQQAELEKSSVAALRKKYGM